MWILEKESDGFLYRNLKKNNKETFLVNLKKKKKDGKQVRSSFSSCFFQQVLTAMDNKLETWDQKKRRLQGLGYFPHQSQMTSMCTVAGSLIC